MDGILSTAAAKPFLPLALDHLVVAARTLEEGEDWLEQRLGRRLVPGGAHPGFGTHNRLLRLGADCYLELIAPDPAQATGPAAASSLLFGLDQPPVARALADGPLLLHTVFRVVAPARLEDVVAQLDYDAGVPTLMSRGDLRWQITLVPRGRLAGDGLLPTLIDWGESVHPCARLPDSGVTLAALQFTGPSPVIAAFPRLPEPGRLTGSTGSNGPNGSNGSSAGAKRGRVEPAPARTITAVAGNLTYSTISANFVVGDKAIIIESRLPARDLA